MKLDLIEWNKKTQRMVVLIKDGNGSFVNLVRRFAMDEVPTLAVEDIEFHDNSSALYDEVVAHRIGLIPVKTDVKSYTLKENCTCKGEGCAKCQLKITLKSAKKGLVLAGEAESQDPKCTFAYPEMPITKLTAKQKIELEATAVLGRGRDHTKWSPGLVFFRKEQTLNLDKLKLNDNHKARIEQACGDIVSVDGKVKIDKEKMMVSYRADACIGLLEEAGAEAQFTDNYLMHVESWGQLSCKEMLEEAANYIIEKIELIEQQIK